MSVQNRNWNVLTLEFEEPVDARFFLDEGSFESFSCSFVVMTSELVVDVVVGIPEGKHSKIIKQPN